jgi:phospholipase C
VNTYSNFTIFDLLDQAGVSWRYYYQQTAPKWTSIFSVFTKDSANVVPISNYFNDIKNESTMPAVLFIEEGGNDEHPDPNPGATSPIPSIQKGEYTIAGFINALLRSPAWWSSVFVLTYDEGGGMHDHVAPPTFVSPDGYPPRIEMDAVSPGIFDVVGLRVPITVVSPWTKPHFVSHMPRDHSAILKLVEARFSLPPLTARDDASDDMEEFFDFTNPVWLTPPTLPTAPTTGTCDITQEASPIQ